MSSASSSCTNPRPSPWCAPPAWPCTPWRAESPTFQNWLRISPSCPWLRLPSLHPILKLRGVGCISQRLLLAVRIDSHCRRIWMSWRKAKVIRKNNLRIAVWMMMIMMIITKVREGNQAKNFLRRLEIRLSSPIMRSAQFTLYWSTPTIVNPTLSFVPVASMIRTFPLPKLK